MIDWLIVTEFSFFIQESVDLNGKTVSGFDSLNPVPGSIIYAINQVNIHRSISLSSYKFISFSHLFMFSLIQRLELLCVLSLILNSILIFYVRTFKFEHKCTTPKLKLSLQSPNFMNLSCVSNPPKTGFNWAPA